MATMLSDSNFQETVQKNSVVLVDFYADWCGPCHILAPTIEDLAKEYEGKAVIAKVDIDDNPNTAMQLNVMAVPTVVVFKNGRETARFIGVQPKPVLKTAIEREG